MDKQFQRQETDSTFQNNTITIAIAGGGLVGLTLALCLHQSIIRPLKLGKNSAIGNNDNDDASCRITSTNTAGGGITNVKICIYEQTDQFVDDVGAGMVLQSNGLRILHELGILNEIISVGCPIHYRSWTRHDGTIIVSSNEQTLVRLSAAGQQAATQTAASANLKGSMSDGVEQTTKKFNTSCSVENTTRTSTKIVGSQRNRPRRSRWRDATSTTTNFQDEVDGTNYDDDILRHLQTLGIRRWKFQKVLYDAVVRCKEDGVSLHFSKKIVNVSKTNKTENSILIKDTTVHTTSDTSRNNKPNHHSPMIELCMNDGTKEYCDLLFASDGCRSCIREQIVESIRKHSKQKAQARQQQERDDDDVLPLAAPKLKFCGVSCLMGISEKKQDPSHDEERNEEPSQYKERNESGRNCDTNPHGKKNGMYFTSSETTTGYHSILFPTGNNETCFQYFFPYKEPDDTTSPTTNSSINTTSWGTLILATKKDDDRTNKRNEQTVEQCKDLAQRLNTDGWINTYVEPLYHAKLAVNIGFCLLEPLEGLNHFVYNVDDVMIRKLPDDYHDKNDDTSYTSTRSNNKIILLGDAAHPPVPYTGQASQVGIEDAATIAFLLQRYCLVSDAGNSESNHNNCNDMNIRYRFEINHIDEAMKLYERIRIPRAHTMLQTSLQYGKIQQLRSSNQPHQRQYCEETTKRGVFFHETSPDLLVGVQYDYMEMIESEIKQHESSNLQCCT